MELFMQIFYAFFIEHNLYVLFSKNCKFDVVETNFLLIFLAFVYIFMHITQMFS